MTVPTRRMRNASEPPRRHGLICASCGTYTVTAVDALFSNPRVGSPQRFCSPACRVAAWRRRQAGVGEAHHVSAPAGGHDASALATSTTTRSAVITPRARQKSMRSTISAVKKHPRNSSRDVTKKFLTDHPHAAGSGQAAIAQIAMNPLP